MRMRITGIVPRRVRTGAVVRGRRALGHPGMAPRGPREVNTAVLIRHWIRPRGILMRMRITGIVPRRVRTGAVVRGRRALRHPGVRTRRAYNVTPTILIHRIRRGIRCRRVGRGRIRCGRIGRLCLGGMPDIPG